VAACCTRAIRKALLPDEKEEDAMLNGKIFARSANYTAKLAGTPTVFALAVASVVIWLLTGPIFHYSDTWQLVMNTWTNVVCFLMVFLIQNSQNRDSSALQVKLDEMIRSSSAKNTYVGIEHLSEKEIEKLRHAIEQRVNSTKK
jgi:low affinity Fe/Cu permease